MAEIDHRLGLCGPSYIYATLLASSRRDRRPLEFVRFDLTSPCRFPTRPLLPWDDGSSSADFSHSPFGVVPH